MLFESIVIPIGLLNCAVDSGVPTSTSKYPAACLPATVITFPDKSICLILLLFVSVIYSIPPEVITKPDG